MPHLLHYAKSKCRTAAPPHAAHVFSFFSCPNPNFFSLSACKSKNFLYFCNQVLANRRDTTLLRQNS